MKLVILGCGRVGATIAGSMSREGHDVTVIDMNPSSFRRLPRDYSGKTVIGNGIDEDTLRRAKVDEADAFVAVTNGDNRNIMSVEMAKVSLKVPKVIARIYDPVRAYAYRELGIDTLCTTCVGAGLICDMLQDKPLGPTEDYRWFGLDAKVLEAKNE